MKTVEIIINPVSGRGGKRRLLKAMLAELKSRNIAATVHPTRGPRDAGRLAAEISARSPDALVVFGGDGTINEVVAGLNGRDTPILIAPVGTENILAKYFGLRASAHQWVAVLLTGRTVETNIARVNGHRFMAVSGVGFDAEVLRRLVATRRGNISYASYVWPILRTFTGYRHPRVEVEVDGQRVFAGRGMVFIGNVPRYAMGLRLLRDASIVERRLDVCIFACDGRWQLMRHALRVLRGRHVEAPDVVYRHASRARVVSGEKGRSVPVEIDGELFGELDATYDLAPEPARFLVPTEWQP